MTDIVTIMQAAHARGALIALQIGVLDILHLSRSQYCSPRFFEPDTFSYILGTS